MVASLECSVILRSHDGPARRKTYATIVLHGYTVMAQNLDYGTQVPGMNVTDNQSNDGGVVEKYCYNDSALYCERYGGDSTSGRRALASLPLQRGVVRGPRTPWLSIKGSAPGLAPPGFC